MFFAIWQKGKNNLKRILYSTVFVIALRSLLFFTGPRVTIDRTLKPIELPDDLDQYLATSEAQFTDLVPNTQKTIIWADPVHKTRTPLAVVYIHGFSATRQEMAPLSDRLAEQLGANLFYTRLTGHGRTGQALAEATVNDWINDVAEAIEIGRRLGDKVIIIGTSTGAPLVTWLVGTHYFEDEVAALVFLSPNFGLKQRGSELLMWPWGHVMVRLMIGRERNINPVNELHKYYWTDIYPVEALLPMRGAVELAREIDLNQIKQPVIIFYSPLDQVIDPQRVPLVFEQFGSSQKRLVPIEVTQDPRNHLIAGDIVSPANTNMIVQDILDFLQTDP